MQSISNYKGGILCQVSRCLIRGPVKSIDWSYRLATSRRLSLLFRKTSNRRHEGNIHPGKNQHSPPFNLHGLITILLLSL